MAAARCAASVRRGAHPADVPARARERQVRRGAAPGPQPSPRGGSSGVPQVLWPPRSVWTPGIRDAVAAAVRTFRLRSPHGWELDGGRETSRPRGWGGTAGRAGSAVETFRRFHLREGAGTRRWRSGCLASPRTCLRSSYKGRAGPDLQVLEGQCCRLPCSVCRPSRSLPLAKFCWGPLWEPMPTCLKNTLGPNVPGAPPGRDGRTSSLPPRLLQDQVPS